ncbi:PQQ-binding-like beta-propeller repeat protein [Glycomyces tarimensis]
MRRLITLFALSALVLCAQIPAGATDSELPRTTASFNDDVRKVAYDGDVIYAGGMFTRARDVDGSFATRHYLAAVDSASGGLLPFAPVLDGQVYDVITTADHLYVAGDFRRVDGVSLPRLARFALDTGELDETWRPNPSATVFAVEPVGDTVYLGGRFGSVGGHAQWYLAAVSASDGAPITSFAPRLQEGSVRDIESGHGRLYASGGFSYVEDDKKFGKLAAFDPSTGGLDRSFQATVYVLTRQIALDGEHVYGALDGRGGEIRAFDRSGEALWHQGVDGGMQAVTVWGGVVIGGGHFDLACETNKSGPRGECLDGVKAERGKLLAIDRDGNLLPWNPGANGVIGVWDLKTHPEGTSLAVGGAFTTFGGGSMEQKRFAVFD